MRPSTTRRWVNGSVAVSSAPSPMSSAVAALCERAQVFHSVVQRGRIVYRGAVPVLVVVGVLPPGNI